MAGNTRGSAANVSSKRLPGTRRATHQPATAESAVTSVAADAPSTSVLAIEAWNDGECSTCHEVGDAKLGQRRDAERLVVRQQRGPQNRRQRNDDDDQEEWPRSARRRHAASGRAAPRADGTLFR